MRSMFRRSPPCEFLDNAVAHKVFSMNRTLNATDSSQVSITMYTKRYADPVNSNVWLLGSRNGPRAGEQAGFPDVDGHLRWSRHSRPAAHHINIHTQRLSKSRNACFDEMRSIADLHSNLLRLPRRSPQQELTDGTESAESNSDSQADANKSEYSPTPSGQIEVAPESEERGAEQHPDPDSDQSHQHRLSRRV